MSLIVYKIDSGFFEDSRDIISSAKKIVEAYELGNSIVVVLSALGTHELAKKVSEINNTPSKREMDMLLATGSMTSAALFTMAIESLGCHAVSFSGYQAGIMTDSSYGNARIMGVDVERIFRELDKRNIVVVAGGQGSNRFSDITTLGPGGCDAVAVALTAVLKADLCMIYSKGGGVYTADPKIVDKVGRLEEISYDELLELSSLGAQVLHSRAVELAKKYNIPIVLRSDLEDETGTIVREVGNMEKMLIRGVTRDSEIARIAVMGVEDKPGVAFRLFSLLAKEDISVDLILQSIGTDELKDISFTVSKTSLDKTLKVINSNLALLGAKEVKCSDECSKVSVVGAGIVNNPGIVAAMFEALYDCDINVHMIATSEIKISALIDAQYADIAVKAIHEKFKLYENVR